MVFVAFVNSPPPPIEPPSSIVPVPVKAAEVLASTRIEPYGKLSSAMSPSFLICVLQMQRGTTAKNIELAPCGQSEAIGAAVEDDRSVLDVDRTPVRSRDRTADNRRAEEVDRRAGACRKQRPARRVVDGRRTARLTDGVLPSGGLDQVRVANRRGAGGADLNARIHSLVSVNDASRGGSHAQAGYTEVAGYRPAIVQDRLDTSTFRLYWRSRAYRPQT